MIDHDENWALSGLLFFMLLFMVSTAYAAPETDTETAPAAAEAAAAEQALETADTVKRILSSTPAEWQQGSSGEVLIPVVAILSVFGGPVILVLGIAVAFFWYHYRRRQMMHKTLKEMIDKGMEIPPHISSAFADPQLGRNTAMRRGFLLSGLGVGLIVFFVLVGASVAAGIGAIPLFIGVGYLLIWHLESKRSENAEDA